jgi:HK97 family phage major capsid protein
MATRSALLKSVRSTGYTGDASLDAVKQHLTNNGYEIPADIQSTWDNVATLTIDDEPKPAAKARGTSDTARGVAEVNAAMIEADAGRAISPAATRRAADRKVYERKVAKGEAVFGDSETAERWGAWMRLKGFGNNSYEEKSNDLEILGKAFLSNNPISGADFIPEEFIPEVIRLVEEYGSYSRVHAPRSIRGTEAVQPKFVTAPTVYYPGEGQTVTESSGTTQLVKAYTKEGFVLTNASLTELEASAVNIADYVAQNFAYVLSLDQDQKAILGDGTSTHAHYTGWVPAMNAVTTNGMIVSASGNLFSEFTYNNLVATMAALPLYAINSPNCKWLMNSAVFYDPTFRTALGLGGTQGAALMTGPEGQPMLLGKPVQFAQVMPAAEADNTIFALVGDFSKGALFATATNGIQVAMSDQNKFAEGLVSWRARVRWAFTVHAPGTTSNKQSGPVAALKSIT